MKPLDFSLIPMMEFYMHFLVDLMHNDPFLHMNYCIELHLYVAIHKFKNEHDANQYLILSMKFKSNRVSK